jgi:hypothetical protein
VQVQEPHDLARRSKGDALGQPDEAHTFARAALGAERNDLPERQERLGDLDRDRLLVEIGPGRQVRLVASEAQRDHKQVVALGMGEAGDRAADAPGRQLLDGRRHLHGGQATRAARKRGRRC